MPWVPVLSALVGFGWYVKAVGGFTLDPTEIGWLAQGDWASHLVGWLFFRNEPWSLPLGTIGGLMHPVGTTVGFTDANPWVALLIKPLSSWLPTDFQFIGPWLALCFALQGVFGAQIMACLTPHPVHRLLGATLFVLAPPLLIRVGHDTLTAHWLLLGLIWLNVRRVDSHHRILAWAFALNGLAAGVHPYLAVMLIPLTLALLTRLCMEPNPLAPVAAALFGIGVLLQTAAVLGLFGYLGSSTPAGGEGFGFYSADLLTFFNAMGRSRWLPALPAGEGQYEGFAFLGSGALVLVLVAAAVHAARRHWPGIPPGQRPLVAGAALLAVFALSDYVTAAGHVWITLRSLYEPIAPLAEAFRSSGRFIWPLHYVVLLGVLALTVRQRGPMPTAAASLVLLAAVAAQAAEVPSVWSGPRMGRGEWPRAQSPVWDDLPSSYRHLVLYPPFFEGVAAPGCQAGDLSYRDALRLADLAYRKKLTINSAHVARGPGDAVADYCLQLSTDVAEGRFARDTVYVVQPIESGTPVWGAQSGLTCGAVDGYKVCVSTESDEAFRRSLAAEP